MDRYGHGRRGFWMVVVIAEFDQEIKKNPLLADYRVTRGI
jgi:hypothetical protein